MREDMTADSHMKFYEELSTDNSEESAVSRLMLLVMLDGYQEMNAVLKAKPFNYTPTNSRAADVAAFLQSHAEERKQLLARLKEAKDARLKEANPTGTPSGIPRGRVRVIK